ncbi:uncharacterized protein LOC120108761 [Phoenix dactylifera]|uniref:Uncharacterized protein LOC120108761 n=1 Tax=Phoenix dactylifera TaxID=42345 RepID=A0A8B9A523_PHODC|nr:uncharacterized protein LOC120108761 [Phoenix dactylifera]
MGVGESGACSGQVNPAGNPKASSQGLLGHLAREKGGSSSSVTKLGAGKQVASESSFINAAGGTKTEPGGGMMEGPVANGEEGGRPFLYERKVKEFQDFLTLSGLIDMGFSGSKFTWCNNQQGQARVWERLDRACATAGWIQSFPDHHVSHLPRIASEHNPLLVSTDSYIPVHSSFRFEKIWLCYPRSWEMVREAWSAPVRGDAMYRVSRRLELMRRRLRRWNREEVRDIFRRIEESEEAIARLQTQEDQRGGLADEELGDLRSLLALHDGLLRQQETFWRQKLRIQWIVEGDRNTRFFHQATVIRRHQNMIRVLRDEEGQLSEDPEMIQRIMESFFRARWTEQSTDGSLAVIPSPVGGVLEEETAALIRSVSEREIRDAVRSLKRDKAPGPDGFPPLFFQRYWMIVGRDVTTAIQQFFSTAVMAADWQRTFITLKLKRQDATEPSHFRLISLCTTLYKAIARILAVRLREGSDEKEFDGIKLDMERAYDRVRWDFLQQSLQVFGFHETWIRSLQQAVAAQEMEVYRPMVGATSISHLLFADDCLLLARSSRQVARRVNLTKSAVTFSPKTKEAVRPSILEILGVGAQEGMMTYLGVPLSGQRLRRRDCTFLKLSIRRRLEGWQMHSLSMMGRITLVRSVLTSVPIYLLTNAIIPVIVLRSLEQLFRNFIWGRCSSRGGVHLMAWDVVCLLTSLGGLGVQSLVARRKALAARHAVRFVLEPESMWSSLMRAKYGALVPRVRVGRHHSPVWREMCARAIVVLSEIRWIIGDGRSIDVLEDSWATELPICRLPTMVDSARLAGCRVNELLTLEGGRWREELIREVFGEQLAESVLSLPVSSGGGADRQCGCCRDGRGFKLEIFMP